MAAGGLNPGALAHPAFAPLQPWLRRLGPDWPTLDDLNQLARTAVQPPRTLEGLPIGFCPPEEAAACGYELHIRATGRVPTRTGNVHDLFNALAWLAFPRSKAAMNARHAARIPREGGARGRLRDLLTLLDESGVVVACADPGLAACVREARWMELFWARREAVQRAMRFVILGHAAYEKAQAPYPGITCKALFINVSEQELGHPVEDLTRLLDAGAATWVQELPEEATPRLLPPLPIFGYPGWMPGNDAPGFYADTRWFRPQRRHDKALETFG